MKSGAVWTEEQVVCHLSLVEAPERHLEIMTSPKFHGATGQGTLSSRGPRLSTIVVLAICSMNLAHDGVYILTNAYRRESGVHFEAISANKNTAHSLVSDQS